MLICFLVQPQNQFCYKLVNHFCLESCFRNINDTASIFIAIDSVAEKATTMPDRSNTITGSIRLGSTGGVHEKLGTTSKSDGASCTKLPFFLLGRYKIKDVLRSKQWIDF